MKIKKLSIRNIASIKEADIDFEKDLNDAITDTPAPVFLISGDTGAGKSVILDAISMALYKTTPRISGVSNTKNNEFKNSQGESIRVASIQQYTRLGIAPQDDCYSELVFEGNDGKTYTAKLSLGIYKGNTDAEGKRPIKYSDPKWTLETTGVSYNKDKDILSKIQEAIGLSFEQFGRMAMLAQGQFAAFLTGDKKEREAILEQLTNTEHFTAYGEAIKRLFDKAKAEEKSAQKTFETEANHIKPAEQITLLLKDQEEKEKKREELGKLIQAVDGQLQQFQIIETNKKDIATANIELQALKTVMEGEEYKGKKNLIHDWEATVTERQRLADQRRAKSELKRLEEQSTSLQHTYASLAADLLYREEQLELLKNEITKDNSWLEARKEQDELYSKAREYLIYLDGYEKTKEKCSTYTLQKKAAEDKHEALKKAKHVADEQAKMAKNAVEAMQKLIEGKVEERNALKPDEISKHLEQLNKEKSEMEKLQTAIIQYNEKLTKHKELIVGIDADQKKLVDLQQVLSAKKTAYADAQDAYIHSHSIFVTMGSSIEEAMVNLRQQLKKEHAEKCPLCGQDIKHELLSTDEFRNLISPLEKERNRCKTEMDTAERVCSEAQTAFDKLEGIINTKNEQAEKDKVANERDASLIQKSAAAFNLDYNDKILSQLEELVAKNKKDYEKLHNLAEKAETLQGEINQLFLQKKSLDQALSEAERNRQNADKEFENNDKTIHDCTEKIKETEEEKKRLEAQLAIVLDPVCPEWSSNITTTKTQLAEAAEDYLAVRKRSEANTSNVQRTNTLLEGIRGLKKNILEQLPNWEHENSPSAYESDDITEAWNKLYAAISQYISEKKSQNETLKECTLALKVYYTQSGKDEGYLDSITQFKDQLEGARQSVKQTEDAMTKHRTTVSNANENIAKALLVLKVEKEEELPDVELLEEKRNNLKEEQVGIIENLASIKTLLEENEKNQSLYAKAKENLEKARKFYHKWEIFNRYFGGTRFRTLVQTYVLRPLLNNANIYLEQITDRYQLTCSEDNEQLSILVQDKYNKNQVRSVTILSGGERFMISLALSLALSSLNRSDMNVNILFIDEGFGTLDEKNLDSVMATLERLQLIAGLRERRVGIISHRPELEERIPVQIQVLKKGEGRSQVVVRNS